MLGNLSALPADEHHRVRQPMTEQGLERLLECFALRIPVIEHAGEAGGNMTTPEVKAAMYAYLEKVNGDFLLIGSSHARVLDKFSSVLASKTQSE